MNTDVSMVRQKFDAVLQGLESREAVSDWARVLREADDREELIITPETDRDRIWNAIEFLEGVDLRLESNDYLYNEADIRRERP